MKKDGKLIWTSILTAIGASLCCITPVLALISGASGMASAFSWLEPLRPYLIGITVIVLSFAWYQKLKPKPEIDCDCDEKPKFIQSKLFLGLITGFAVLMLAFPYYGTLFYPTSEKEIIVVDKSDIQIINISIEGMTCASCENHVNHSVDQLNGILKVSSSFEKGDAEIEYDQSKTTIEEITNAVNSTGYTVTDIKKK